MRTLHGTPWLAGCVLSVLTATARLNAQDLPPGAVPNAAPVASEIREHGRVRYQIDLGPIYGERQQPYVFGVTGRTSPGYAATEAVVHWVPLVLAATHGPPF